MPGIYDVFNVQEAISPFLEMWNVKSEAIAALVNEEWTRGAVSLGYFHDVTMNQDIRKICPSIYRILSLKSSNLEENIPQKWNDMMKKARVILITFKISLEHKRLIPQVRNISANGLDFKHLKTLHNWFSPGLVWFRLV